MSILATLGIDGKLFLAQLVNFAILLFLLQRFLYRPILNALDVRSKKIEKSLEDAKTIEERLRATEVEQRQIIESAKKEASQLVEHAATLAEQKRNDLLSKTKDDVAAIIADAKKKITLEKEQMLSDAKQQLGDVVVNAMKIVLSEEKEKSVSPRLIEKVLEKTTKQL